MDDYIEATSRLHFETLVLQSLTLLDKAYGVYNYLYHTFIILKFDFIYMLDLCS